MIEIEIWNKDEPERRVTVQKADPIAAGTFLTGSIAAAVRYGGTLCIEIKEIDD